ncbi:MAG: type III pantothenate kinase [Planctomycetaceae bacterium]
MILCLDVGNTSIKYGRFDGGRRLDGGRLAIDATLDALPEATEAAAVSVNPEALARVRARLPRLRVLGVDLPLPLPVHYDPPEACGADRVAGAFGALAREEGAEAVLLLDAGTCLTATVAVRGVGVLGGAILPGSALMARALHEGTARLPLVAVEAPRRYLGRTTGESIRSGLHCAMVGAARELIVRLRLECPRPARVVAAGSGAGFLAAALPEIDAVHLHATLWGLYLAVRADV